MGDEINVDVEKMVNAMAQVASYGDTVSSASGVLGQSEFGGRVKNIGADNLSSKAKCITGSVLGLGGTSNAANLAKHLEDLKQLIIKNDKDAATKFMMAEGNMDPILADRLSKMRNSLDEFSENPATGFELWLSQNSYSKDDFFTDMAKEWGCKNADEAYQMFVAVIIAECNKSKDDALSCVSVALNRCERNNWSSQHGTNPFDQMFYGHGNQYETVTNGRYLKYLPSAVGMDKVNENLAAYGTDYETLYNVVTTAVEGGLRNNDYTGFRAPSLGGESLAPYQSDFRYENPGIDRQEAEAAKAARKGTIYDLSGDNKKNLTTGSQTTGSWQNGQYIAQSATGNQTTTTPATTNTTTGTTSTGQTTLAGQTTTGTTSQQGTQSTGYQGTPTSSTGGQGSYGSGGGYSGGSGGGYSGGGSTGGSIKTQPQTQPQQQPTQPQQQPTQPQQPQQPGQNVPTQPQQPGQNVPTQPQQPASASPQQQVNNYYPGGSSGGYSGGGGSYAPVGPQEPPQPLPKVPTDQMQEMTSVETIENVDYSTLGFEEPAVVIEEQSTDVMETPIVEQVAVVEPVVETRKTNTGAIVGGLAALGAAGAVALGVHAYNSSKNDSEDDEEDLNDSTEQYTLNDSESGYY